jgi:type I restriction enzyme S subunit
MNNWKRLKLNEIASYSTKRICVGNLTLKNYISTENMLPQKAGKTVATSLPGTNAVKYSCGQTLISNIRPYFKKILYASMDGGCSSDVLVFEISEEVDSKFFYYLLSQDIFFNYMMAGSKGTKMPRGDKQQIMMYPLLLPTLS